MNTIAGNVNINIPYLWEQECCIRKHTAQLYLRSQMVNTAQNGKPYMTALLMLLLTQVKWFISVNTAADGKRRLILHFMYQMIRTTFPKSGMVKKQSGREDMSRMSQNGI